MKWYQSKCNPAIDCNHWLMLRNRRTYFHHFHIIFPHFSSEAVFDLGGSYPQRDSNYTIPEESRSYNSITVESDTNTSSHETYTEAECSTSRSVVATVRSVPESALKLSADCTERSIETLNTAVTSRLSCSFGESTSTGLSLSH